MPRISAKSLHTVVSDLGFWGDSLGSCRLLQILSEAVCVAHTTDGQNPALPIIRNIP